MNAQSKNAPHWSFWLVAVLIFIWNAMGVMNYIMQLSPESLKGFSEAHRFAIENRPLWATAGFAVAVFGGTLASVFLLLRKPLALTLFIVSMLSTGFMMVSIFGTLNASGLISMAGLLVMTLIPFVVSVLFVWYANFTKGKGWLG